MAFCVCKRFLLDLSFLHTGDKVHTEMSIYLPRADLAEESDVCNAPTTTRSENTSNQRPKLYQKSRTAYSSHPHMKYSHTTKLDLGLSKPRVVQTQFKHPRENRLTSATKRLPDERPITAYW